MGISEKEIQSYIWEHRCEFWNMVEPIVEPTAPTKKPWEYEPWELIYQQLLSEYIQNAEHLQGIDLFGCEIGFPKEAENTMRSDFLGCIDGVNGFVVCELKVNKQAERQAYTELFAYGNYVRSKFSPMGRQDIFYLLITPMKERIVREATICNLIYDRNRIVVFVPQWDEDKLKLSLKLWIPDEKEFEIVSKTSFAFKNIDVFKVTWRCPGKWSPKKIGAKPTSRMIHQLNQVSAYAAQLMEARGINGFVYCSQLYPKLRDEGYYENGLVLCGINPYKSAKTKLLYEHGCSLKDSDDADIYPISLYNLFPQLKNNCDNANKRDNHWYWMGENWSTALIDIAFEVRDRLTRSLNISHLLTDYGGFDWDSFLNNSSEDFECWNYDIHLTGVMREFYCSMCDNYYKTISTLTNNERKKLVKDGTIQPFFIDMINSHTHIRSFIKSLTKNAENDYVTNPLEDDIDFHEAWIEDINTPIVPNIPPDVYNKEHMSFDD